MILPLPDIRDRLGWMWIFRECWKYEQLNPGENADVMELPMEVFRTVAERVSPAYVEEHYLIKQRIMVSGLIIRGNEHLVEQMEIKEFPAYDGGPL